MGNKLILLHNDLYNTSSLLYSQNRVFCQGNLIAINKQILHTSQRHVADPVRKIRKGNRARLSRKADEAGDYFTSMPLLCPKCVIRGSMRRGYVVFHAAETPFMPLMGIKRASSCMFHLKYRTTLYTRVR